MNWTFSQAFETYARSVIDTFIYLFIWTDARMHISVQQQNKTKQFQHILPFINNNPNDPTYYTHFRSIYSLFIPKDDGAFTLLVILCMGKRYQN